MSDNASDKMSNNGDRERILGYLSQNGAINTAQAAQAIGSLHKNKSNPV